MQILVDEAAHGSWEPRFDAPMSRYANMNARGPYRAAVPPRIAGAAAAIEPDALGAAADAGRELTRFGAEAGAIVMPFASILLRTESSSSSEIERIAASAKQLALAELGAARSENARLVQANVAAMRAAIDFSERLDEAAIIEMHRALLESSTPDQVAAWRAEQAWIGGGRFPPHNASFVPPHHDRVADLMADLVSFLGRTDIPAIAHAAISHAQFETIHPFTDGNGRTGRALVQGLLRAGRVTQNVSVPVSAGLLSNVGTYFDALSAYRDSNVSPIVSRFADAIFHAVANGRTPVADLNDVTARCEQNVRARAGSSARASLALLPAQPVVSVASTARELGATVASATGAIERLEEYGVLERTNSGARNRLWQASEVLAALDTFATRARGGRVR